MITEEIWHFPEFPGYIYLQLRTYDYPKELIIDRMNNQYFKTPIFRDKDFIDADKLFKEMQEKLNNKTAIRRLLTNCSIHFGDSHTLFKGIEQHLADHKVIDSPEIEKLLAPTKKIIPIMKKLMERCEECRCRPYDRPYYGDDIDYPDDKDDNKYKADETDYKEASGKCNDRKIESDVMKKSSSFSELKGIAIKQQKKIISSVIKKIRTLSNHLGR